MLIPTLSFGNFFERTLRPRVWKRAKFAADMAERDAHETKHVAKVDAL